MKNKTNIAAGWIASLTTIGIFSDIYFIFLEGDEWDLGMLYWLIPITYAVFLFFAENDKSIWKIHVEIIRALISVFKKKV